jgi:hypothetical protein
VNDVVGSDGSAQPSEEDFGRRARERSGCVCPSRVGHAAVLEDRFHVSVELAASVRALGAIMTGGAILRCGLKRRGNAGGGASGIEKEREDEGERHGPF